MTDLFANRYELKEIIGSGGMSEVFLAYDTKLNRSVAIKILLPQLTNDPIFLTRFKKEAISAASLNHPNIVAIYDSGDEVTTDKNGVTIHKPFIVMEYVDGITLETVLKKTGKLSEEDAIQVTEQILDGVSYAHKKDVIHRDIKPSNIMLTKDGHVKIMDFGIAKLLSDATSELTVTQTVIGTAQYISPEQAKGESSDARADLYSIGCVFYEILTGVAPFRGDNLAAITYNQVHLIPESVKTLVPNLSDKTNQIVNKALEKNPNLRYQTADGFLRDLQSDEASLSPQASNASNLAAITGSIPTTTSTQYIPTSKNLDSVDESDYEEKLSKKTKLIIIFASIGGGLLLLGIILLIIFWPNWDNGPIDDGTVSVPNLSSMTNSLEACQAIEAQELVCDIRLVFDDTLSAGAFISQDPAPETMVEKGSTVSVRFSQGAEGVQIPDVAGFTYEESISILIDKGLHVSKTNTKDEKDCTEGMVISTTPDIGNVVEKGTGVELNVCSGLIKIGDYRGLSQEDATRSLEELGLEVVIETVDTEVNSEDGKVINQDPVKTSLKKGATVTLGVGKFSQKVAVPNVAGMSEEEAIQELINNNLVWLESREVSSDKTKGTVLYTDPKAGTKVDQRTSVTLFISSGPASPSPDPSNS